MEIGNTLTYEGRTYVLVGLEPMSVPDRKADVRDVETGEVVSIPCSILAQLGEGLGKDP
jgi:hypothetical protein